MNIEEKIQLIEEGTLEVIDAEELKEVLNKDQPIAYTGYEPSGKIHLGHAVTVQKLKQLQKLGFKMERAVLKKLLKLQTIIKNVSRLLVLMKQLNIYTDLHFN